MLQVAVCDDNDVMLDLLAKEISKCFTALNVPHEINTVTSGAEFVARHNKSPFDVVFLDIKMPDMDGFEVAKRIRNTSEKTYIIFVTTESSLVYDSFDYRPFYFIPKGKTEVLKAKLKSVIGKLVDQISENRTICLELPYGEKKFINSDTIYYIASKSNYLDIVCKSETIHIRRKLNDLQKELPVKSFARIHNRYIVNMRHLSRIDTASLKAILYDETELEISRAHKAAFLEQYNIFLRNFG